MVTTKTSARQQQWGRSNRAVVQSKSTGIIPFHACIDARSGIPALVERSFSCGCDCGYISGGEARENVQFRNCSTSIAWIRGYLVPVGRAEDTGGGTYVRI